MENCHLKGETGDRLHAVLCAEGYNIQWLLRMMARKGITFVRCVYLRLCTVAAVLPNWELALLRLWLMSTSRPASTAVAA